MNNTNFIKSAIRKILNEQSEETSRAGETTTGAGRGGWKGEIAQAKALAINNPNELMKRLKVSGVSGGNDIEKLGSLLNQASSGTDAMSQVFSSPVGRKNKESGYVGVRLPVKLVPPRDAMKYVEFTILGAQNSGQVNFKEEIQVEILGGDILAYFAPKPKTWGKAKSKPKDEEKK